MFPINWIKFRATASALSVLNCPHAQTTRINEFNLSIQRPVGWGLLNGPQRYNELLQTVTSISQKELTRNLRELTVAGLGNSRTAPYNLTKLGKGLMPMFKTLLTWGTKMLAAQ